MRGVQQYRIPLIHCYNMISFFTEIRGRFILHPLLFNLFFFFFHQLGLFLPPWREWTVVVQLTYPLMPSKRSSETLCILSTSSLVRVRYRPLRRAIFHSSWDAWFVFRLVWHNRKPTTRGTVSDIHENTPLCCVG